jgi:hypothetical protein
LTKRGIFKEIKLGAIRSPNIVAIIQEMQNKIFRCQVRNQNEKQCFPGIMVQMESRNEIKSTEMRGRLDRHYK